MRGLREYARGSMPSERPGWGVQGHCAIETKTFLQWELKKRTPSRAYVVVCRCLTVQHHEAYM